MPEHLVLPESLTGVASPIVIALGDRFPMIGSHKVIAAYGCLAPRLVTGQFDPTSQRAVWPSTGNYCRGGVAISRIMGCRGVAVLPAGMSRERFEWLERWVADPADIIRTPGTESNVKEIYDECAVLDRDPDTVIFNQFSEFANHVAHYAITGRALERVFEHVAAEPAGRAGGGLRVRHGLRGHDRRGRLPQGAPGRTHGRGRGGRVPHDAGRRLRRAQHPGHRRQAHPAHPQRDGHGLRGGRLGPGHGRPARPVQHRGRAASTWSSGAACPRTLVAALASLGFSSICNVLAAIKVARQQHLGPDDVLLTVATDGAAMYGTELERIAARDFPGGFDAVAAGEAWGRWLAAAGDGPRAGDDPRRSGTGCSTSATSPGWSSRACRSTSSRRAATSGSGPRPARSSTAGTS